MKPILSMLIEVTTPDASRVVEVTGRDAWALSELIEAGARGATPIDNPGPRWAAYVFNLRHKYGLDIETVTEPHGEPYGGTHARYVLHSLVRLLASEMTGG